MWDIFLDTSLSSPPIQNIKNNFQSINHQNERRENRWNHMCDDEIYILKIIHNLSDVHLLVNKLKFNFY